MFYCLFLPKHDNTVMTIASVKVMSGCLRLWYTLTTCMFYCLFLPKHDNTVVTIASVKVMSGVSDSGILSPHVCSIVCSYLSMTILL